MSKQISINDSITLIPDGYSSQNSSYSSISTSYPITNAYTDSNSYNYAYITCNTGSSAATYISFTFSEVSDIPSNATIDSITAKAKVQVSSSSYISTAVLQLYSGATAKGSSTSAKSTTATQYSLTAGTWTREELDDLQIRYTGTRGTNNTNRAAYLYFYGADITINYSVNGTAYEITSVSNTDLVDSIDPEGTTDVEEGGDYTLNIYADDISNVIVEDNGTDVTSQLVQKELEQIVESYPESQINTGVNSGSGVVNNPIGYSAENPNTSSTSNIYASRGSTGYVEYSFDLSSIPNNAIIDSVSVKVYGKRESSTTDSTHMAKLQLYSGSTLKGSSQEFTSTSLSSITLSDVGTWTREELQNAKLRFTFAYYGGYVGGVTWKVEYTTPNPYFWQYTLTNVNDDHTIYVTENVVIPPDEDPTVTYYPITISSINATTEPNKGTTRVESGTTETITIYPSDPLLSLAIDNGVDITSQLVQHGGVIPDPTVTTAPGASYGFNLNSSTGYYVSANKGVDESASVCRVSFNLPVRCLVTLQFINYAEATYDFGVFGNIDVSLSTAYYSAGSGGATITDTDYKLACNTSSHNTSSTQTLTYEIPSGAHYIDIKFSKDDATSNNNDTLQWKITDIEPLEANDYYTYTLSNISEQHSLIFIFGNVTYYFVNSSTNSNSKLFPNGQMVQLPGDDYRLVIIPEDNDDTVTVTDNNTDVTSQLERKEITTEKEGVSITVVNYIYKLTDIQATHNIVVSSSTGTKNVYINDNGWVSVTDILKKDNDKWSSIRYTRIWIHNGTTWVEDAQRTISTKGIMTDV